MSNSLNYPLHQTRSAARASLLNRTLGHLVDHIRHFQAVNELDQLSDRQLRDIGVERSAIEQVADREIARLKAGHPGFRAI